ncbi:MAG: hypothetical protein K2P71_14560, partial [Lachnospiraceae bacterium]|nr:hypothetical protein [Lachnospiraceae bacterium]
HYRAKIGGWHPVPLFIAYFQFFLHKLIFIPSGNETSQAGIPACTIMATESLRSIVWGLPQV